jgi:Putative addiction module component
MSSMSLTEILAERQELVRRAIEVEDQDLTAEEKAILEERLADFRRNPNSGIPGEQLKAEVLQRLNRCTTRSPLDEAIVTGDLVSAFPA